MSVCIHITSCLSCPHKDHSGSFTPGGAKSICGHSDACNTATSVGRKSGSIRGDDKFHWKYRRIGDGKVIPHWCPLK